MKKLILSVLLMILCRLALVAQQPPVSYKFDFGPGEVARGYTQVLPDMKYTAERGFGFWCNAPMEGVDRGGKDALRSDFCTSKEPFFFSVKLPEGNYRITVITGDTADSTATTVKVECRRLMAEKITTAKGQFATTRFLVHVRDTMIRGTSDWVRIKPRERSFLHWDDQLTIEFNNAAPKVCGVEITPVTGVPTLFLAGNSTVVDQAIEPWAAWGQMIQVFFEPEKLVVANYAESGEAMSSFIGAKRLEKVLSQMKKGDYLFIEFAHNDQKQKGEGIGPFTSYKKDLKYTIGEVRKKGGIPVLITSMNRRSFDSTGHIVNTLGDYPAAMRQTAQEEGVALIDLNAMSKTLYEAWGPENSVKAFVHYPANTFPGQDKELKDDTHFNSYGAWEIARCIAKGMADNHVPLAAFLKPAMRSFDPAHPDPIADWKVPPSPFMATAKPDGN